MMVELDDLLTSLSESRQRTLDLVVDLSDDDVEQVHNPIMSPLVWDLAHIAAYEDLWISNRFGRRNLLREDLAATYDAFETPRQVRGSVKLLDRKQALEYLEEVRARSFDVTLAEGIGNGELHELVLRHEQQHNETMLQAIELARFKTTPRLPDSTSNQLDVEASRLESLERVRVPAGPCLVGAGSNRFSYDNERPQHKVIVDEFFIGKHPVTNAEYLEFIEAKGYERQDWWSTAGWEWKTSTNAEHPEGWVSDSDGSWRQWRIGGLAPLVPSEPVIHVSWFEADAFARAHGARLPSEIEWEKAATWDPDTLVARSYPWGEDPPTTSDEVANLDHLSLGPTPVAGAPDGASPYGALGMLGNIWEWTASDFSGYSGFVAHPYKEYSEVFFNSSLKVLRGGSWGDSCSRRDSYLS